ncbi:FecR domain-containing protein [Fulvivirgaceae bacterium BMA12]|uniref:FecR domain-containing protein n=1 Tax=Agaribacillus aureus TaxID=3051825 RepID=A0ABT8LI30_9BACT|nr:FecR domain-containing protein [Fulvivirgaceae bacterium BMA12]
MAERASKILDLLENENFVQWVLSPNQETNHYWSKWLLTHSERKEDVEKARQIVLSTHYKKSFTLPDEDYNQILSDVVSHHRRRIKESNDLIGRKLFYKISGVAAAIVLMVGAALWYNDNTLSTPSEHSISEVIRKKTGSGQKLTLQLPDGSKVVLNAESEITYAIPFSSNREVKLSGEAFFDVKKDPEHPFTVLTRYTTTKVVGTSFNIRSYTYESETAISVLTGKVEVSDHNGHEAALIPAQQGVFDFKHDQLLVTPFSAEAIAGWKDGLLLFNNTPLTEVMDRLEKWYGVQFEITDGTLMEGKYTGRYNNASLEKILDGVSYASGFDFKIKDKTVLVHKKQRK